MIASGAKTSPRKIMTATIPLVCKARQGGAFQGVRVGARHYTHVGRLYVAQRQPVVLESKRGKNQHSENHYCYYPVGLDKAAWERKRINE